MTHRDHFQHEIDALTRDARNAETFRRHYEERAKGLRFQIATLKAVEEHCEPDKAARELARLEASLEHVKSELERCKRDHATAQARMSRHKARYSASNAARRSPPRR